MAKAITFSGVHETGSKPAVESGIKRDSFCPIIKDRCHPKCVFHSCKWLYGDMIEFDENDKLIVDDDEPLNLDKDILRECQILDIVRGLHRILGKDDADDDLPTLIEDMATRNWSINTYEQNPSW